AKSLGHRAPVVDIKQVVVNASGRRRQKPRAGGALRGPLGRDAVPPRAMTVYLLAGAFAGYALLIGTNPVRASLLDGLRAVRRYPRLWVILGLFGFGYALSQLAQRVYFYSALAAGEGPDLLWSRSPYRSGADWWFGAPDSLWYVPARAAADLARGALLPALDSLGGLFNNA